MTALAIQDISYTYPSAPTAAIDGITLDLLSSGFTALLGANGSGKSTLGRLIAGLLAPDAGRIVKPVSTRQDGWSGVGMLFQNPDEQLFNASVEQEIAWGLENLSLPRSEIEERVEQTLALFDLHDIRKSPPEMLSDGQKQLTALASVWAMRPDIIILDEAAAFLDPVWKHRLGEFALEFSRERGVLWISTRAEEARHAGEIWLIKSGKIVRRGTTELLDDKPLLEALGIVH